MRIIRPFLLVFTCLLAIAALLLRLPDSGGGKSGRTGEFVSARKFEQLERGTQEEDFDPSALLWREDLFPVMHRPRQSLFPVTFRLFRGQVRPETAKIWPPVYPVLKKTPLCSC